MPASSRIVVPELPASSGAVAAWSPLAPQPVTRTASGPRRSIVAPSACMQASDVATSSPGARCAMSVVPSAIAPSIA